MEDKPVNIEVEIKKESQDEEIVTNGTNAPDLITSADKNVKNEPLEEQAGCSSLQITNCFSIPNVSTNAAVVDNSSISSTPNDSNKPSTLPPNDVVKTEKEDASTEPSNSNPSLFVMLFALGLLMHIIQCDEIIFTNTFAFFRHGKSTKHQFKSS